MTSPLSRGEAALAMQPDTLNGGEDLDDVAVGLIELQHQREQQYARKRERIKSGVRNQCESCLKLISKARLQLVPEATKCTKCRGEEEGEVKRVETNVTPERELVSYDEDDDGTPANDGFLNDGTIRVGF